MDRKKEREKIDQEGWQASKKKVKRKGERTKERNVDEERMGKKKRERNIQGRIHDYLCRGRLGRGSKELGRGSIDLGRGILKNKLSYP